MMHSLFDNRRCRFQVIGALPQVRDLLTVLLLRLKTAGSAAAPHRSRLHEFLQEGRTREWPSKSPGISPRES
jgi:hypothetical protein